jgi:hypothetical protein
MSRLTGEAHVLWMELDGEIYSPAVPLQRATLELIERDLWNGAYAGVCHAVYSYGAYPNGGSFCRDVTREVAARLGGMSFAATDEVKAPVRSFLEAMGVACREDRARPRDRPAREVFEMVSPVEPVARARRNAAKRRQRTPTPQELRAQPQLKLPIAGGKAAAPATRGQELVVESEQDDGAGVEALSLRDTRSLAEQRASWDRFRAMIRSWRAQDGGAVLREDSDEPIRLPRSERAAG